MTQPIKAVLVGAGQRGMGSYGPYAIHHPDEINFIAVAEPVPDRRLSFAEQHNIPTENQYPSWEELLRKPRLGEAALICTQDQMHTEPTISALIAGYDVLLEKPMAPTLDECRVLVKTAAENSRQLHICHVLRYTRHFKKMKAVVESGVLGDIVNVSHRENVAWYHMAHSFVRGNWRNLAQSTPMILAKCCHDLDILVWLLDDHCETLNSVGDLIHYRVENAPEGATKRCLDGCAVIDTCRYYAPFIYVDHTPLWRSIADTGKGIEKWATSTIQTNPGLIKILSKFIPDLKILVDYRGWPSSAVADDATPENIMTALMDGPYGRCVYHCDNDVVDNQVVSMKFQTGTSVTLTMHGHSHLEGRSTRIEGSNATLMAEFSYGGSWVEVNEHRSDRRTRYDTTASLESGHGGGDFGLMAGFVRALREKDENLALTSARTSLESHLMAFAAEDARLNTKTVKMEDYRRS
jgi:predicted dehydrogenase